MNGFVRSRSPDEIGTSGLRFTPSRLLRLIMRYCGLLAFVFGLCAVLQQPNRHRVSAEAAQAWFLMAESEIPPADILPQWQRRHCQTTGTRVNRDVRWNGWYRIDIHLDAAPTVYGQSIFSGCG